MWFIHSKIMKKKSIFYLVGKALTYVSLALFAVFSALKLFGVVTWSWWLVSAPFVLPLLFCVVVCLVAMWLVRERGNA